MELMKICVVHAADLNTSCAATTAIGIIGALIALGVVTAGFPTMIANRAFDMESGHDLLKQALRFHRKFGWNILFSKGKNPSICGSWEHWQTTPQTEQDIKLLYGKTSGEATAFGPITGYNGLVAIDFDWPWPYLLWEKRFGARANTLTIRTPNGGFRAFFFSSKPVTVSRFKHTLHVEILGSGQYAVFMGRAVREDGEMGKYAIFKDMPIRKDDSIVTDTVDWLEELLQNRYKFLTYPCIKSQLKGKIINPSHELRLIISDFMISAGIPVDEAKLFFEYCPNYKQCITDYQLEYTKKRVKAGLKPPRCETIRRMLAWNSEDCRGCPRRRRRQLPRFQIVTLEELISSAKPIEYICEPILPKRSLVLLVGKGGVGKSLTCLHVAGAVSSGGRIFGRFECEKTRVLIIDEENTASVYKQRAKLLGLDSLKNIHVINLQDFQLTDQSHFEFLREILRERSYGLIIIDCWTNVVPGIDENKAGEVADILKRLRRLAYEYDATLLVIHHSRKNIAYAVEEIDEPRGSTVLVNEPDMVYLMSKEKMGGSRIVKTVKARYGNEVAFRLAFKQSGGRLKIEWIGELGKKEVESRVQACMRIIKRFLKGLRREASRKEILEAVRGFPPRIVDRSLQYLVRIGEVERVAKLI